MNYYGWRIVVALALTQTVGYGVLYYAFGVFVIPMEVAFGWSRAETSGAYSLGLLVAGLAAIPVGHWVDRHGARGVMTLGSSLGVVLLLAWSRVESLGALYLIWVGIGLAMSATLYEVAFTVVAVWFRRHRARAVFAITLVAGLASTIFIPLTTLLVNRLGWRATLVALAVVLAAITLPLHALILRRHPGDIGFAPDGVALPKDALANTPPTMPERTTGVGAVFSSAEFWWLALAFALARLSFAAMGVHLVPLLLERGYTPTLVALAVGAVGPLQLLGRALFLPVTSKWPVAHTTAAMLTCVTLAFAVLALVPGLVGIALFVLLYGSSNGALTLARAELVAQRYGATNYGSLTGAITLTAALMGAFAPFGAGLLRAGLGNYQGVLWGLAGAAALAIVALTKACGQPTGTAHEVRA